MYKVKPVAKLKEMLLEIFTDHGVGTQIVRPDSVM